MKRFSPILFFLLGIACVPAFGWLYLRFAHVPVAVSDPMFPMEESMARTALRARIDRERPHADPVSVDNASLTEGAYIYKNECAMCHGSPGNESKVGNNTFPRTPQFFRARPGGNRPQQDLTRRAASYHWYVENGVRLTAMPSYRHILSDKQQWEVSNFLANRDGQLPDNIRSILAQSAPN
jgi:thiosulfate dehydrogenase